MARKPMVDTFELASGRGPYDEFPVFPPGRDPLLCLSRNDRDQPFFLICEHDCVLAQMSGTGRIEFRDASVRYFEMVQGDFVYVPSGVPHRYRPQRESVQYRYKAETSALEGVLWACSGCQAELHRELWDADRELPQEAYARTTSAFNRSLSLRTCKACNSIHPEIAIEHFKWAETAAELRAETASDEVPASAGSRAARRELTPHPTKHPLHQNVYWAARMANAQLLPLFPYLDAGSIVPCLSLFSGRDGKTGNFIHCNSIDEIVVNFGAVDSPIKPGTARVGPKRHGVGSRNATPSLPTLATVGVITQRHPIDTAQAETVIFICHACNHELLKRDFDGNPPLSPDSAYFAPDLPTFATVVESAQVAETFNAMGAAIACPKCGAANEPFPLDVWGWDTYRNRTQATLSAMRSLTDASARARARTP